MRLPSLSTTVCLPVIALTFSACAHKTVIGVPSELRPSGAALVPVKVKEPVTLRLKAEMSRTEQVAYSHRAISNSYEDQQLRHHKEDALDFVSQAETVKADPPDAKGVAKFTQVLTVLKKDGNGDLHEFAMPELGEKLEVTADSTGHIYKSGDYPANSIFYVPPMSLPAGPVSVGDTWTMQASWLSLEEMVPYQLDMVSILKGFWNCGKDTCAEIEISGDVGFQGPLSQTLQFKSTWQGRIYFAINAGTVVWSRTDSEERLLSDKIRRDVDSCLEASLIQPADLRLSMSNGNRCEPIPKTATQVAP